MHIFEKKLFLNQTYYDVIYNVGSQKNWFNRTGSKHMLKLTSKKIFTILCSKNYLSKTYVDPDNLASSGRSSLLFLPANKFMVI